MDYLTAREIAIMAASKAGDIIPAGDQLVKLNIVDMVTNRAGGFVLGCEWFAQCDRDARYLTPHPILGYVPTCAAHNAFAGYGTRSDQL